MQRIYYDNCNYKHTYMSSGAKKLVASIDKLKNTTGWSPTETLDSMVKSDLTHKL